MSMPYCIGGIAKALGNNDTIRDSESAKFFSKKTQPSGTLNQNENHEMAVQLSVAGVSKNNKRKAKEIVIEVLDSSDSVTTKPSKKKKKKQAGEGKQNVKPETGEVEPSAAIASKKRKQKNSTIQETEPQKKFKSELPISQDNNQDIAIEDDSLTTKTVKKKKKDPKKYDVESTPDKKRDPDQEARTIFVGNLPLSITRKDLSTLFKCYGKVESVRFRSAIPNKSGMTKKAAVISQNFNEEKASINAYVVMESVRTAKKALATNGMLLHGHHIRVDLAEQKQYDNTVTIFVGNLPFKCQDEELYGLFAQNMDVESVRIVRDAETGICKGFGFVAFKSKDNVELALKMNETDFKGRMLRVMRVNKPRKKKMGKLRSAPLSSRGMKKGKKGVSFQGDRSCKGVKERKRVQRKIKYANAPSHEPRNKLPHNSPGPKGNKRTKGFKKFNIGNKKSSKK